MPKKSFSDWWYEDVPRGLNSAADFLRNSFKNVKNSAGRLGQAFTSKQNFGSYLDSDWNNTSSWLHDAANFIGQLRYEASGAPFQNQFNLDMDSTKYQRNVADLQAAGYNPLVTAFGGASGGSVSSGSGVNTGQSMLPSLLNGIAHIVSSSIHAASNDNRTLTMANSAASRNAVMDLMNQARIVSREKMNDARIKADENYKFFKGQEAFDRADYYREMADYYSNINFNKEQKIRDESNKYWKKYWYNELFKK